MPPTSSSRARPWETSYNGWTWAERIALNPIQNALFRSGQLARPTVCSVCGFSDPARIRTSGFIYAHLERYDRPAELFSTCKKCHAALHARFRDPQRWLSRLQSVELRSEWPRLLSLDPASQWRTFQDTYPDGLPLPSLIQPDLFGD